MARYSRTDKVQYICAVTDLLVTLLSSIDARTDGIYAAANAIEMDTIR